MPDRLSIAEPMDEDLDDKPFCMTALSGGDLGDIQEMTDSLDPLGGKSGASLLHRNRVLAGICLVLPLSVFMVYLIYR